MTRRRIPSSLIAIFAWLVSFYGPALSQEGVPAIPYKQVPEIVPFIKEQIIPDLGDGDIDVMKIDLNMPPDGTPEYIVMLDNQAFCGSGGCTTEVVRIKPSGEFERLAGILRYGFGLAYTATNGMRDLLTEGKSGPFIWRFDGKEYRPHKGHPKAATTKPKDWKEPTVADAVPLQKEEPEKPVTSSPKDGTAQTSNAEPDERPKPYVGHTPRAPGCVGEYGWRRGYDRKVGYRYSYAVFGHCTDPENMLLSLTCRTDQSGVEIEIQIDPERSGTVPVAIQVDRAEHLMNATTRYVEMFGYHVPTFRISPRSPLLNALARGQLARIVIGKKSVKIHLNGAANAIATMRSTCRG